jgi:hypothetical protein
MDELSNVARFYRDRYEVAQDHFDKDELDERLYPIFEHFLPAIIHANPSPLQEQYAVTSSTPNFLSSSGLHTTITSQQPLRKAPKASFE